MIKVYNRQDNIFRLINFVDIDRVNLTFDYDDEYVYVTSHVSYITKPFIDTFTVSINRELYKSQIIMITLLRANFDSKLENMVFSPKFNLTNGGYYHEVTPKLVNIASVWIPETLDKDIVVVPHIRIDKFNDTDKVSYSEINLVDDNPQKTLLSLVPEAYNKKDIWYLKHQHIKSLIDPLSSIAYLEDQVDILYKIINILLEKTNTDVSEYKQILDTVDQYSVSKIKSLDKINSEIKEDKSKIRAIQKEYYKLRDAQ